jgi:spore coat polysaccharide biosynthesis predicted glycosyltransferase SpsG
MTDSIQLAIRADGSHEIGLGHLYRSSIIADEALARGHEVTVVTRTPEFARQIAPAGVAIESVSDDDERNAVSEWLTVIGIDAVVTDSKDVDTAYQRQLSSTDAALTVFSDDDRHQIHADIFVNGNLYGDDLNYDWSGTEPTWCLGSEYLLLREPFRSYATQSQPFSESVSNILVTMGGVDNRNRTPDVLSALESLGVPVTAIIGPGFENGEEIRKTAAELNYPITVREDPDDLPELFLNADIAVCTLGTTTYQLLAAQTPIVGIPDNETPIPDALSASNAAVVLPRTPTQDEVERAVSRVASDRELRRSLWRAGERLISGDGAERVLDVVEQTVASQS